MNIFLEIRFMLKTLSMKVICAGLLQAGQRLQMLLPSTIIAPVKIKMLLVKSKAMRLFIPSQLAPKAKLSIIQYVLGIRILQVLSDI